MLKTGNRSSKLVAFSPRSSKFLKASKVLGALGVLVSGKPFSGKRDSRHRGSKTMGPSKEILHALEALKLEIVTATDLNALRDLTIEINKLLDVLEVQAAVLEARSPPKN